MKSSVTTGVWGRVWGAGQIVENVAGIYFESDQSVLPLSEVRATGLDNRTGTKPSTREPVVEGTRDEDGEGKVGKME